MIRPITPREVEKKRGSIPDEVIEACNILILKRYSKPGFKITFNEIIQFAMELMVEDEKVVERETFFIQGWLDIEPFYRKAGWKVSCTTSDWGESFDPFFWFTKKL